MMMISATTTGNKGDDDNFRILFPFPKICAASAAVVAMICQKNAEKG